MLIPLLPFMEYSNYNTLLFPYLIEYSPHHENLEFTWIKNHNCILSGSNLSVLVQAFDCCILLNLLPLLYLCHAYIKECVNLNSYLHSQLIVTGTILMNTADSIFFNLSVKS